MACGEGVVGKAVGGGGVRKGERGRKEQLNHLMVKDEGMEGGGTTKDQLESKQC